jgi:hypothetical protein
VKIFGVFRVKKHDIMQKNLIFSSFRGGHVLGAPPPGSAPALSRVHLQPHQHGKGRQLSCKKDQLV